MENLNSLSRQRSVRVPLKNFKGRNVAILGIPNAAGEWTYSMELWHDCHILTYDHCQDDIFKLKACHVKLYENSYFDHLWIDYRCFLSIHFPIPPGPNGEVFAVGRVEPYTREKDGTQDYGIVPVSLAETCDLCLQMFLIPYLVSYYSPSVRSFSASLSSDQGSLVGLCDNYREIFDIYPKDQMSPYARRVFAQTEELIKIRLAEDSKRKKRLLRQEKRRKNHKGFGVCV